MHYISKEVAVGEIYKKMCLGTELEKIKTTEEIKNIIVTFLKCPTNQTAFEIHAAHPEITTGVASTLRHLRKLETRKKNSTRGEFHVIGIKEVVREISLGVPKKDIKKAGVSDALFYRANRFIQMALKNKPAAIIAAKLRMSEYSAKIMLETFNQSYRKYFKNKQAKIILEV